MGVGTNRRVSHYQQNNREPDKDFPTLKKRQWITMKKTLLAVAVLAAAGSVNAAEILKTDQGSVDFYGQLRARMDFKDSNDYAAQLTTGSSRLGLNANYALSDSTKVLGKVEFGVPANSEANDVNVRVHTVGFATDFGTFKFGKDWTTSDDIGGTDYSYVYGGSANGYGTLNDALHASQLKYSLDLENLWVKAGYGFADGAANGQDLAELYVGTSFGPVALHVGGGKNQNSVIVDSRPGAALPTTDLGVVSNTYYEVTGVFTLSEALELSATYYGSKLERKSTSQEIDHNGFSVGASWAVADMTTVYGGYELSMQKASELEEDYTNIFGGVEYKFASWARVFAEVAYQDGATIGYVDASDTEVSPSVKDGELNASLGMRVYW